MIISGSEDGYIYIYDIVKGNCVEKLKNHCRAVSCIDLNSQKNSFISAGHDNTATYWTHELSI